MENKLVLKKNDDNPKDIIKNDSFERFNIDESFKNKGDELLKTNEFFKDLSEIMENETFLRFFKKYFVNTSEVKISIIYMKLYETFKDKWEKLTDKQLDERVNTFLIWKIMKDRNLSRFTISTVLNSLDNKKIDIFDELKDFMNFTENKKLN